MRHVDELMSSRSGPKGSAQSGYISFVKVGRRSFQIFIELCLRPIGAYAPEGSSEPVNGDRPFNAWHIKINEKTPLFNLSSSSLWVFVPWWLNIYKTFTFIINYDIVTPKNVINNK